MREYLQRGPFTPTQEVRSGFRHASRARHGFGGRFAGDSPALQHEGVKNGLLKARGNQSSGEKASRRQNNRSL